MDNIRVISLKKKTNKRDLYREILSSSSKVKDIIAKRKTKNKKFDYLDKVPKGNVLVNIRDDDNIHKNILSTLENKQQNKDSKIIPKKNEDNEKKVYNLNSKKKQNKNICHGKKMSPKKNNENKNKNKKKQISNLPNKPIVKENKTFENLIPNKSKTQKVKRPNQKKIDEFFKNKNNVIKGKLNRLFNKKELIQICSIIKKLNDDNNYSKIHYILRKINRNQTIQLLKVYNISKNRNKAPLSLLKNILFNYLTANIILIY